MNVTRKALLIVTVVILTLSAYYLHQGIAQHAEGIEEAIEAEERAIDTMVEDIEQHSYALYRARLGNVLAEHPEVVRAFAAHDRARLYEACLPLFRRRRAENPSLHAWDFNLPDGTVFLRVQDPDSHGDNIGETREMLRAVHDHREPVSGYDVGRHGAIYWVARPVFHEGRYVGATEFGLPVEQLTKALERRFGTQVAVTVKTAAWNKATLVGSGYRHAGDRVLIAPKESLYMRMPGPEVFAPGGDRRVSFDGGTYLLHTCAALRDYRGRLVGNVLVLQDITERVAHTRRFVLGATLVTAMLLALSLAVLYASFGKLIGRLEVYAAENKLAREEIERSRDDLDLRVQLRTTELREANLKLARESEARVEMDKELWASHDRLLRVFDGMDAVVYVADLSTYKILFANQYAVRKFGDLVGRKCWETIQSGQAGPCAFCTNRRLVDAGGKPTGGGSWEFKNETLGRWFVIQERAIPWVDNRLVRLTIATDITARKVDEDKLRASLREKEILIKEVHHRVKNNMQIISSLLRLQGERDGGGVNAELFRDSQSRIRAMSLIHEKLYRSDDLAGIDMRDYLGTLVGGLATSYGLGERVRTRVAVDQVRLNIDTAVLCGLIVNELVSNALKHAFPEGRRGEVTVGLSRVAEAGVAGDRYQAVVADDGIGLPQDLDPEQAKTLGLRLVTMLARHQLQGEVVVTRRDGTRFAVLFRELEYRSRT